MVEGCNNSGKGPKRGNQIVNTGYVYISSSIKIPIISLNNPNSVPFRFSSNGFPIHNTMNVTRSY